MIYEYRCENCDHKLEALQGMNDKPLKKCPECSKMKLKRIVTGGNGFRIYGQGVHKPTSRMT